MKPDKNPLNSAYKIVLLFLLFIHSHRLLFSQEVEISGKITDINSREPLAFVNIIITGTSTGGTTDINGEFKIKSSTPVSSLSLSYVGYKPLIFQVGTKFSKINIGMEREVYTLKEVEIIAKENPAIPIIKKAAKNRNINNFNEIVKYSGIVFNDLVADKNTIYSPNSDNYPAWYMQPRAFDIIQALFHVTWTQYKTL